MPVGQPRRDGARRLANAVIRGACALGIALAAASTAQPVRAERPGEYSVKAAVLYNLTKFVDWPGDAFADQAAPVVFCVLGGDPFGPTLDRTLQGHLVGTRTAVVRRVSEPAPECHVLFIAGSDTKRLPAILERLGTRSVLTVGDAPGFVEQGGMIGLVTDTDRVKFDINLGAAERAGLRISARVLVLASTVLRKGESR